MDVTNNDGHFEKKRSLLDAEFPEIKNNATSGKEIIAKCD